MKQFRKLLREFVSIPSVSTDSAYRKDIEKAVKWLVSFTTKSGLQVKTIRGFGNPIIIAKTPKNPLFKTILIYGHYDVQPAQKKDGWKSDPFSLTEKKGRLFGRGAADNKAQILTHLYSVAKLMKEKKLGFNIIFLVEGNEETGSALLKTAILKNKKDLQCDCVLISDGGLIGDNSPALEASFRGSSNIEIFLQTGKDDLHSGLFGGSVPNAAEELSLLISKLHDKNKRILIPGFYDRVKRQQLASGGNEKSLKKLTGTKKVFVKSNSEFETRTGLEPAIEVTGFMSGYIDAGFRNSVPSKATAKVNVRFAPGQNVNKMILLLKKFLTSNTPTYVDIKITGTDSSPGANLDFDNEFAKRAQKILTYVYKKTPVTKHCGGTLPIVNDFKEILGVPQVMIPLANEDCGMHSASENISVTSLRSGLSFSEKMFSDSRIK